ncbi:MAG: HD-GYP domain-containing protein [Candidatus Anammoxibacter sp.]
MENGNDGPKLMMHSQLIKYAEDVSSVYKQLKKENELLVTANKELEESYYDTVLMGFEAMNLYGDFLGSHCKRVSYYSEKLAKLYSEKDKAIVDKTIVDIKLAALLHDIGLLGLPKSELIKLFSFENKKFTDTYRDHPVVNIRPITSARRFRKIAKIISAHHENVDGSGFPKGLRWKDIPIESRIITIVDSYDEIKQIYIEGAKPDKILKQMSKEADTKYDLNIFMLFKEMILAGDPLSAADTVAVDIEELSSGMVLAKPIKTEEGLNILSADTIIKENHILHLKRHEEFGGKLETPITIYNPDKR